VIAIWSRRVLVTSLQLFTFMIFNQVSRGGKLVMEISEVRGDSDNDIVTKLIALTLPAGLRLTQ